MKKFTVYCLLDPDTLLIRYIGLTNNVKRRQANHTTDRSYTKLKEHSYYRKWRAKLDHEGKRPIFAILGVYVTEKEGLFAETCWIKTARAKGFQLVNYYDGSGKGYRQGQKRPPEWCENLSKGHKGISRGPQKPEHIQKVVASRKARWEESPWPTPNVGRYQRTEKHRRMMAVVGSRSGQLKKGKPGTKWTDEQKAVASQRRRGETHRSWTDEERKQRSNNRVSSIDSLRGQIVEEQLSVLAPHQQRVMKARLGIGQPPLGRNAVADLTGWSKNRVRWAERVALKKLGVAA